MQAAMTIAAKVAPKLMPSWAMGLRVWGVEVGSGEDVSGSVGGGDWEGDSWLRAWLAIGGGVEVVRVGVGDGIMSEVSGVGVRELDIMLGSERLEVIGSELGPAGLGTSTRVGVGASSDDVRIGVVMGSGGGRVGVADGRSDEESRAVGDCVENSSVTVSEPSIDSNGIGVSSVDESIIFGDA